MIKRLALAALVLATAVGLWGCSSSTRKQQAINALNAVELATAVSYEAEVAAYNAGNVPISAAAQADIEKAFQVVGQAEETALTAVTNWDTGDPPRAAIQAISDAVSGLQAILAKVGASQAVQRIVELVNIVVRNILAVYDALRSPVPPTAARVMAVRH